MGPILNAAHHAAYRWSHYSRDIMPLTDHYPAERHAQRAERVRSQRQVRPSIRYGERIVAKAHRKRPAILKPDPYQLFELEQAVDALREHVRTLSLQFDVLGFDALHSEVAVIDARSSLARVSKLLNRITEVTGWHPTIADCLDRLRAKVDALAQHLPRVDHEDESLLGTAV